jgi:hypothetical protein
MFFTIPNFGHVLLLLAAFLDDYEMTSTGIMNTTTQTMNTLTPSSRSHG